MPNMKSVYLMFQKLWIRFEVVFFFATDRQKLDAPKSIPWP